MRTGSALNGGLDISCKSLSAIIARMSSFRVKRLQWGAALLAAGIASAAGAQVQYPQGAVVQQLNPGGAADKLAGHVRDLASEPRSLTSLLGAGESALELGDPQTALTFFARAEEVAPRDGRAKAGMGSAFVQLEQPHAAFKFFNDALAMGVSLRRIAGDRGLAYDMIGDPARAQADYAIALEGGHDPEVVRRLAISKAISGDKDAALALLEPQLQQQDRSAWRARAFVLALAGDPDEAVGAVAAAGGQAHALRPFLERLPMLSSADQAMAVHFGRFPQNLARAIAPAGRPVRGEPANGGVSPVASVGGTRTRTVKPPRQRVEQEKPATRTVTRTVRRVGSRFPIRETVVVPVEPQAQPQSGSEDDRALRAGEPRPVQPIVQQQAAATDLPYVPTEPARTEAAPAVYDQSAARADFAEVVTTVQSLPSAEGDADLPRLTKAAPAPAKKAKPEPSRQPKRIFVQLAASPNKTGFSDEYRRLTRKASALLSGKTAWTAPLGSTNRLLVGPFRTEKEARDLVNELAKLDIDSFSWTSAEGQEIEKIGAR